jgi:hypothetical protein
MFVTVLVAALESDGLERGALLLDCLHMKHPECEQKHGREKNGLKYTSETTPPPELLQGVRT